MDKSEFTPYLAVWLLVLGAILLRTWTGKKNGAGLMLAYCFQLWLFYWTGAFAHSLPWSQLPDTEVTFLGFRQSTFAIAAFGIGGLVIAPVLYDLSGRRRLPLGKPVALPGAYLLAGLVSFAILAPIASRIPSMGAVSSVGQQLILVGICLGFWKEWKKRNNTGMARWLVCCALLPAITLLQQGFIGYGVIAASIVLAFIVRTYQPRYVLVAAGLAGLYLGISVYVAYMRERTAIRASVWGEEEYASRFETAKRIGEVFEPFDVHNNTHLVTVDERLNQNFLVGAAVLELSRTGAYSHGETLVQALFSMVPRAIWPDKPTFAGSGNLVTRFTGIVFAENTSVGIGPVLEFYANFNTIGVIIGFLCMGALVGVADLAAEASLLTEDWLAFGLYFLLGISFLNVSGSMVEVAAGSAASLVVGNFVNVWLRRRKIPSLQRLAQGAAT